MIMCEDKIFITSILQCFVLNRYHTYILYPGMEITEAMICQHLYWPEIINSVQKAVTNCDTCLCTKWSNLTYSTLPAKESGYIPWNKLCVGVIGTYVIRRKLNK